jgi:hypothetical protein
MKKKLTISTDLTSATPLYRYMAIESFLSLLETKEIHLSRVDQWEDKWEALLSKIPAEDSDGSPSFGWLYQELYGQCWSRLQESDAMWRIYSPTRTGIQIATTVENFNLIEGARWAHLGSVVYFDTIADLLDKSKSQQQTPFNDALLKRAAFSHEQEVRFLTRGQFLDIKPGPTHYITLHVDLPRFIEGVVVDPRADDWYVDAITQYCDRAGLTVRPVKSSLYESDPHLKVGLVRVHKEKDNLTD